jgi:threonine dehydrogenase-like Zn-dependent dehydrogenase
VFFPLLDVAGLALVHLVEGFHCALNLKLRIFATSHIHEEKQEITLSDVIAVIGAGSIGQAMRRVCVSKAIPTLRPGVWRRQEGRQQGARNRVLEHAGATTGNASRGRSALTLLNEELAK